MITSSLEKIIICLDKRVPALERFRIQRTPKEYMRTKSTTMNRQLYSVSKTISTLQPPRDHTERLHGTEKCRIVVSGGDLDCIDIPTETIRHQADYRRT